MRRALGPRFDSALGITAWIAVGRGYENYDGLAVTPFHCVLQLSLYIFFGIKINNNVQGVMSAS